MKRIVVALGGNAILQKGEEKTAENQYQNINKSLKRLSFLFENDYKIAITHGNGPQVGLEFLRHYFTREKFPPYPLDVLNASTEGWIGYMIVQNLKNLFEEKNIKREAVAVITQVVVDKNDPDFKNPSKPIGDFMEKEEAEEWKEKGWEVKEDAGRGWRIVVPSPKPIDIIEKDLIKSLFDKGVVVVGVGGGGIPVINENGKLKGVKAVIDKDRASALLASLIKADILLILTSIDKVYLNFNTPDQKPIDKMNIQEAEKYLKEGHFKKGSMYPTIEAGIEFIKRGGKKVIIAHLNQAKEALEGKSGTQIIP